MVLYAYKKGHRIQIFSTLVGLSPNDAMRLVTIPIDYFQLHLPDACGKAKIPITTTYKETLRIILSGVKNISFMNMGGEFRSSKVEEIGRDKIRKRTGRVGCPGLFRPDFSMLPNGDVYVCCVTRGLGGMVGSLAIDTYQEIMKDFYWQSLSLQKDTNSFCHYCMFAQPYWYYLLAELKRVYYNHS